MGYSSHILGVPTWILVSALGLSIVCLSQVKEKCTEPGWFGPKCQYRCHCADKCDQDGECIQSSQCAEGWFGPGCQYANLATSLLTKNTPRWLLDSNDTTCNKKKTQSVNVTFTQPLPITWLRLHVNDPRELQNFHKVCFDKTCYEGRNATVNSKTVDIHFNLSSPVQTVTISGQGVKSLCSLYISGGRNVALKQNTNQSSTAYDGEHPRAVDGITSGNYSHNSCTHTDSINDDTPSWSVQLSRPYLVNRYVLYNRAGYECRLVNFTLASYNETHEVFRYNNSGTKGKPVYTVNTTTTTNPVSRVNISSYRYGKLQDGKPFDCYFTQATAILTLCEVELYGESVCERGTYGRDCEHKCNCADKEEPCFISTGGCPSGCAAGFQGENCNTKCVSGKYGTDCRYNCSQFCNMTGLRMEEGKSLCHHVNGNCTLGCTDGYMEPKCTKECEPGKYGADCRFNCSQFCNGKGLGMEDESSCHHVSGNCNHGCEVGYQEPRCTEACEPGKYGAGCMFNCSQFCNVVGLGMEGGSPCDHASGACIRGCEDGYEGPNCVDKIQASSISVAAISTLIPIIFILVVVVVGTLIICRRPRLLQGIKCPLVGRNSDSASRARRGDNSSLPGSEAVVENPPRQVEQGTVPSLDTSQDNTSGPSPTSLAVKDLPTFMTSSTKTFFQQQFLAIPNNTGATSVVGMSPENKLKNRYKNICPYDHSRVHLLAKEEKGFGDYINASFIQGYQREEKFIATQGPTKATVEDFVLMLWEQRVDSVVMLTNLVEDGKLKCERYWPEDRKMLIGGIQVELTTTDVFADYTIRRLQLKKEDQPVQTLTQFHFTAWPDKDIPTTPWGLVDFEQRVFSCHTSSPIVVHCSAGIGRTGTFIALHNVLKEAEVKDRVDFFTTVAKMRQDRMNMVQTAAQYEFLHRAAQVGLVCMGTTVTSSNIADRITTLEGIAEGKESLMEAEFRAICAMCEDTEDVRNEDGTGETDEDIYQNSQTVSNRLKNRFSTVLPKEYYRVQLKRERKDMGTYINAVFLPSFSKQRQQILTQLPLPTTVTDFWRLVTQYNVSLIVAFQRQLMTADQTIGDYLPLDEKETASFSHINVKSGPAAVSELWEERKLEITTTRDWKAKILPNALLERHQRVTHLQCTTTDLDPEDLLALIKQIKSHDPVGKGRALYMCRNGAAFSGLLNVLSLLLDRLDNDHRLTVPLVVGAIKAIRPQVIPTLDQYRLLYKALKLYIDLSNVYSNFPDSTS